MSDISPRLSLPYLAPAQAQKHVTHNEALQRLDLLAQLTLQGVAQTTPPTTPQEGQIWALGASPAGDWTGRAGDLAAWTNGAWLFVTPQTGWQATDLGDGAAKIWDGTAWTALAGGTSLENVAGLGVNSSFDAFNRLVVASEASLLTHEGAGHQLKINKAQAGDTASLLFQTGFSGRAEMGTTGSDDFAVKVSPDGVSWTDALIVDGATGHLSGAAVQQGATDVTPGRLARVDHTYGPASLLGTVSQSAGLPTGAVIEQGSTADGSYVRFADGTQICTHKEKAMFINSAYCAANWNFPADFVADPSVQLTINSETWGADVVSGVSRGDVSALQGNLAPTAVSAQAWARSGVGFGASDGVTLNLLAIGRWI